MSSRMVGIALGMVLLTVAGLTFASVSSQEEQHSPCEIKAAHQDLQQLKNLATDPKMDVRELWKLWQEFRLRHSGEPECLQAAEAMSKARSPLDKLDRRQIPTEDRLPWLPAEVVAVLGEHRGRHWQSVGQVAFSPDGKLVASIAETIRLWDATTMQERAILRPSELNTGPLGMAFIPYSGLLATCFGEYIIFWDVSGPQPREKIRHKTEKWVQSFAVSADGRTMVSRNSSEERDERTHVPQSSTEVIVWDVGGEKLVKRRTINLRKKSGFYIALSSDGKLLAVDVRVGAGPTDIQLWRLDQPAEDKPMVLADVGNSYTFLPDGKTLLTPSAKGACIWDVSGETPKLRNDLFGQQAPFSPCIFSIDGAILATLTNRDELWLRPLTEAARRVLRLTERDSHRQYKLKFPSSCAAFSPDGKTIVLGGQDGTVRLWDVDRAAERFAYKGHRGIVCSIAFTPDCRSLVSGGQDCTVRWWGLTEGKPKELAVLSDPLGEVAEVLCAPQGRYVVSRADSPPSAATRTEIRLWDFGGKPPKSDLVVRSSQNATSSIAFSPNGKYFIEAGGEELPPTAAQKLGHRFIPSARFWDFTDGKLKLRSIHRPEYKKEALGLYRDSLEQVAFTSDSRRFLCKNDSGDWRTWTVERNDERELGVLQADVPLDWMFLSPDGKSLATFERVDKKVDGREFFSHYSIHLCDLNGLSVRERRQWKVKHEVFHLAFSPDCQYLLSFGAELTVWSIKSGEKVKTLPLPIFSNSQVALAPDGRHIALGNTNGTIYILRLNFLAETQPKP